MYVVNVIPDIIKPAPILALLVDLDVHVQILMIYAQDAKVVILKMLHLLLINVLNVLPIVMLVLMLLLVLLAQMDTIKVLIILNVSNAQQMLQHV